MRKREMAYRAGMLALAALMVVVMVRGTCGKPKPAQAPMLIEPANGARLVERRPGFRWEALDGIEEYQIEIAENMMFDPVIVQTTVAGTSFRPTADMTDGDFYWHVRAKQGKYWGMWQEAAWMFTIYTPEPEMPELSLQTIHFDFDKSDIRKGDAQKLEANAQELKGAAGQGFKPNVMVEGHCDPVGTAEYNMALGQRRADAARAFLVKLGVPAGQLATISYGEERLVTQDEEDYEMNRRAEFKAGK